MKYLFEFIPESITSLTKGYSFDFFKKDFFAGIAVGMIAMPLAMAFAIASGASPEQGLYTAVIAGFLISAFGGSRVQIGGPTGAFVLLVYNILHKSGYEGLVLSTFVAGFILCILGAFSLGSWIRYVPHPLIVGFTAGLALVIFSCQVGDFFGLRIADIPADFLGKWAAYLGALPTFSIPACMVGLGTLVLVFLIRRFMPNAPWSALAILISTAICSVADLPVETVRTKYGQIVDCMPSLRIPSFSYPEGKGLDIFLNGCLIAFLGAVESLLCCVIGDTLSGNRHKPNCELMAQGIANFASALFGGLPATGAIARTAANVKSGAKTPIAGMVHAISILIMMSFFSPFVSQVPLASLAAVLMVVAWNMSDVKSLLRLTKAPPEDGVILGAGFFLTVFLDITAAIGIGMVISSFVFMKKMSVHSRLVPLHSVLLPNFVGNDSKKAGQPSVAEMVKSEGIQIYEMEGPFFFGSAYLLQDLAGTFCIPPKRVIFMMGRMPLIDASGADAVREFFTLCKKNNTKLVFCDMSEKLQNDFKRLGLGCFLVGEHFFQDLEAAVFSDYIKSNN